MSGTGGIDMGALFRSATSSLSADGQELQNKIDTISQQKDVNQKDLLQLQYAMGQYNAKLESISSVVKSLQDMLKSLAQRTG